MAKAKTKSAKDILHHKMEIGGVLRLRLLEFEAQIGLVPYSKENTGSKRKKHHLIYGKKDNAPAGMHDSFPEEVGAMRRLGKPVNKCYALDVSPYRISCLPYFYYDGFHALLYVEKEGKFLAAWSEQETDHNPTEHVVKLKRNEKDLNVFLDHVLPVLKS